MSLEKLKTAIWPQADMNRSVLLISALCGRREEGVINQALNKASQVNLEKWEQENIPYTVRKKRQEFLKNDSQTRGKLIDEKVSVSTG